MCCDIKSDVFNMTPWSDTLKYCFHNTIPSSIFIFSAVFFLNMNISYHTPWKSQCNKKEIKYFNYMQAQVHEDIVFYF